MKRTVLEKIAGSFRTLAMCGFWGLHIVIASVLLDEFDNRGFDYYAAMDIEDHATHVLYLMGFCLLLMFSGLIGMCGIKMYCFWFDKIDPTAPDAP
ncbi:MAG: hypothetical protein ABL883_07425 [Terricaulis sp.]